MATETTTWFWKTSTELFQTATNIVIIIDNMIVNIRKEKVSEEAQDHLRKLDFQAETYTSFRSYWSKNTHYKIELTMTGQQIQ